MGVPEKQSQVDDERIKNTISKEFFVVKRTAAWSFIGGSVAVFIALTGVSLVTGYAAVKSALSDQQVQLATNTILKNEAAAEAAIQHINELIRTVSANDRNVAVLTAASTPRGKNETAATFTLEEPGYLIVQAAASVARGNRSGYQGGNLAEVRSNISVTVDGRPCASASITPGSIISKQEPPDQLALPCSTFVSKGGHKIVVSGRPEQERPEHDQLLQILVSASYIVLRFGSCVGADAKPSCTTSE